MCLKIQLVIFLILSCLLSHSEDFADYGVMLEIRDVQYFPDGRSVLDTVGGRRFKVLSRGCRDGYNTAKVEFIKDMHISDEERPGESFVTCELTVLN